MHNYKQLCTIFLSTAFLLTGCSLSVQAENNNVNTPAVTLNTDSFNHSLAQAPADKRSKGKHLQAGDCIAIVGAASNTGGKDIQSAVAGLEAMGFRTKLTPSATAVDGYLAGSDEMRANDLNAMFLDDEVDAILCLRGGYGSARILDKLNYDAIAKHPKLLIGYSDITALHTAIGERSQLATIHGPMLTSYQNSTYNYQELLHGLTNIKIDNIVMPANTKLDTVAAGTASGIITGGNLSIIASLVGTPYELNGTGSLLFIEEVGEDSYKIDRMLLQLWQSGLLQRVNGIILGEFYKCGAEAGDYSVDYVLEYYARLSGKPVIRGLPAGHGDNNMFLPLGVHAQLKANADGSAQLIFDEAYAK